MSNTEGGIPYRFNVINCEKVNSQFNLGMQPLLYSVTEAKQGRRGWVRTGCGISYYRNNFVLQKKDKQLSTKTKSFYTLTFTLVFPYSNGTYYLAYHYPYTYSMMQASSVITLLDIYTKHIMKVKDQILFIIAIQCNLRQPPLYNGHYLQLSCT